MKKDWKYIIYISIAFGLFVAVKLFGPKQYNWTVTFSHEDKNPYGAFALHELMPSIFSEGAIHHSYETLYEIKDSLKRSGNIFIVCSNFSAGREDTDALLRHVEKGGTAFIAAEYFWGHFSDTVEVSTYDYFFKEGNIFAPQDSSTIQFLNPALDTATRYHYRRDNIHNYFSQFDSARTTVVAANDRGYPVAIKVNWGKGSMILSSTPLAFTNINLLAGKNETFISGLLSYLPQASLEWTEYYHLGRMEIQSPLRFILTNAPLSWAYYITLISLLLFMAFEMKRRQRIIPVLEPFKNTTMEFVATIGNLYFHNKEHKNIAEKKILFFLEQVRSKFWVNTQKLDETFIKTLSAKSGRSEEEVRTLIKKIGEVQRQPQISAEQLMDLNRLIEKFNGQE